MNPAKIPIVAGSPCLYLNICLEDLYVVDICLQNGDVYAMQIVAGCFQDILFSILFPQ